MNQDDLAKAMLHKDSSLNPNGQDVDMITKIGKSRVNTTRCSNADETGAQSLQSRKIKELHTVI